MAKNPTSVFEILNTRGEPLKESDHIKNTVMYEADVIDDNRKSTAAAGECSKMTGGVAKTIAVETRRYTWIDVLNILGHNASRRKCRHATRRMQSFAITSRIKNLP